jgi:hypothetical protein
MGRYVAVFNISNILGWKVYSLNVTVSPGVYGLYVNFPKAIATGENLLIDTYLMQGDDVVYYWTFDNVTRTANRTGILI